MFFGWIFSNEDGIDFGGVIVYFDRFDKECVVFVFKFDVNVVFLEFKKFIFVNCDIFGFCFFCLNIYFVVIRVFVSYWVGFIND